MWLSSDSTTICSSINPKICSIYDVERLRPRQRRLQAVVLHVTAPAQNGSSETGVAVKSLAEERAKLTRGNADSAFRR